jgi:hypothetical protein
MRLKRARGGVIVSFAAAALASTLASPFLATANAATDDVPDVRVTLRSISLDGYTGNIVVVARVRCTPKVDGVGTASWHVKAVQELRAQAGAPITCDGTRRRATLQLDPNRGRFHPGTVNLTVEQTAAGTRIVEIESSSFSASV